jgi:hypothetical protein
MTNTSRKVARKALGVLLSAALVGDGKLASAVYDYVPRTFTASPVVCVGSLSTAPAGQGLGTIGPAREDFEFQISSFVALAESDTYTASTAEDLLDDIEAVIRGVIRANQTNAAWKIMRFQGQPKSTLPGNKTRIVPVKIGGKQYNLEAITVTMEIYDA